MNLNINNKNALVTGAGRGIGESIAVKLAENGVRILAISRTKSDLISLTNRLNQINNLDNNFITLDLMNDKLDSSFLTKLENFGDIDIAVHNAGGTLSINDPFCEISDWRKVFRLNFESIVELNNFILPMMQKNKWGRVINISSISAMENHGPVPYCAAKAALTAYTRSMGGVVAPDGVVMSAILPGAVFTADGYWDNAKKNRPEHVEKYLTERQRIGRFGDVNEIANFVLYLASDLASFNTGSIIPIDGGQGRGYFGQ